MMNRIYLIRELVKISCTIPPLKGARGMSSGFPESIPFEGAGGMSGFRSDPSEFVSPMKKL